MDRLVCGDVGFGKTEVALRAAAAAALAGKQVAIVAPTTVLVRQHLQTAKRRFAGLGIAVGHLSRLVKPADAKAVKEGLAAGAVRVVVGTHALVGKGIRFADLGLVVIDEEQRFGAAQKAKLRELARRRPCADAHRDADPAHASWRPGRPPGRERHRHAAGAAPADPHLPRALRPGDGARGAGRASARRGGQSFVVCPRIEDIDAAWRRASRELVPELELVAAHGRHAGGGDRRAHDRASPTATATCCSPPTSSRAASTCRAPTPCWSGAPTASAWPAPPASRPGRARPGARRRLSPHRPGRDVAPATEKRLETLEALDRLGAGFAISARDLDQRGAGDLLGEEQAGHVRLIGAGLYRHLLARALARRPRRARPRRGLAAGAQPRPRRPDPAGLRPRAGGAHQPLRPAGAARRATRSSTRSGTRSRIGSARRRRRSRRCSGAPAASALPGARRRPHRRRPEGDRAHPPPGPGRRAPAGGRGGGRAGVEGRAARRPAGDGVGGGAGGSGARPAQPLGGGPLARARLALGSRESHGGRRPALHRDSRCRSTRPT